jgi:hypothetical protein
MHTDAAKRANTDRPCHPDDSNWPSAVDKSFRNDCKPLKSGLGGLGDRGGDVLRTGSVARRKPRVPGDILVDSKLEAFLLEQSWRRIGF